MDVNDRITIVFISVILGIGIIYYGVTFFAPHYRFGVVDVILISVIEIASLIGVAYFGLIKMMQPKSNKKNKKVRK